MIIYTYSQCKKITEIFYIKPDIYFILTAHLSSDQPHPAWSAAPHDQCATLDSSYKGNLKQCPSVHLPLETQTPKDLMLNKGASLEPLLI